MVSLKGRKEMIQVVTPVIVKQLRNELPAIDGFDANKYSEYYAQEKQVDSESSNASSGGNAAAQANAEPFDRLSQANRFSTLWDDDIPAQFHYDEYKELDDTLVAQYGKPFSYKKFPPEVYYTIPYGYDYTYLYEPEHLCDSRPFIVGMIMSTARKPQERQVMRDTWFKQRVYEGERIEYVFLVASTPDEAVNRAVQEEAEKYQDILHLDHMDSYNNITLTIMHTFNWLHRNCRSIQYIVKFDTDSFVNFPKLVRWVHELPADKKTRLYHGNCYITSFFIRQKGNKWHTPYEVMKNDLAWPYCIGTGYIISADLLAPMVHASRHYSAMLRTEDMSVGWSAYMLNVTAFRYHDYQWVPPPGHDRLPKCRLRNFFIFHYVKPAHIQRLMEGMAETGPICDVDGNTPAV